MTDKKELLAEIRARHAARCVYPRPTRHEEPVEAHNDVATLLAHIDSLSPLPSPNQWRPISEATQEVHDTARLVKPRLGQACAQASMSYKGNRFAFVFDNPGAVGFMWMQLPLLPTETTPAQEGT